MQPQLRSDFRQLALSTKDPRSVEQILEHYLLEKALAEQLKAAPKIERKGMYKRFYEELFSALPHHPQHNKNSNDHSYVTVQSSLLKKLVTPGSVLVEIGAGDARLSIDMASHCSKITAVDVTDVLFEAKAAPANVSFLLTDGTHIGLPDSSVDFIYSNQLMEHLHPDDAYDQLCEIYRILKRGGKYFCITPNLTTGPHDISQYFDYFATGFHLREYSFKSLSAEMRNVGFRRTTPLLVRKGRFMSIPVIFGRSLEFGLKIAERLTGRSLRSNTKIRALLGINMLAVK